MGMIKLPAGIAARHLRFDLSRVASRILAYSPDIRSEALTAIRRLYDHAVALVYYTCPDVVYYRHVRTGMFNISYAVSQNVFQIQDIDMEAPSFDSDQEAFIVDRGTEVRFIRVNDRDLSSKVLSRSPECHQPRTSIRRSCEMISGIFDDEANGYSEQLSVAGSIRGVTVRASIEDLARERDPAEMQGGQVPYGQCRAAPDAATGTMDREEIPYASQHDEVGTIGQFVRGKTSLAAAIVKVLAGSGGAMFTLYDSIDQAPCEARGITISAAHVGQEIRSRRYGQIDCPSYGDAVLTGSVRMGGAILVELVAGCAMSEVRGQITLARQTCWLTSEDGVPKMGKEAILGSLAGIGAYISQSKRPIELSYQMPITDVSPISGHGIVLVGRVGQGILEIGQECENFGFRPTKLTVINVAILSKLLDRCQADEDVVGMLPCGTWCEDVEQGQLVGRPGSVTPHTSISSAPIQ